MRWGRHRGLPDDGVEIVAGQIAHWPHLDDDEQDRLLGLTDWLLRQKHWEAANGFALDDTIRVVIAAQAALLILGLTPDDYQRVCAIIVYPSTSVGRGVRAVPSPGTVADDVSPSSAWPRTTAAPCCIAWDQAQAAARHPGRGHNVVFHEFAHKLDMLDGVIDGTPPLDRDDLAAWVGSAPTPTRTSARASPAPAAALRRGQPRRVLRRRHRGLLRPAPGRSAHEPDLYEVLQGFYRQDPAARVGR